MSLQDTFESLRQRAEDLREQVRRAKRSPTLALARPELGATPNPLRRVLEPVVAIAAALVLAVLFGIGMWSFSVLFLTMGLMYAIVTKVFGIELDLDPAAFR